LRSHNSPPKILFLLSVEKLTRSSGQKEGQNFLVSHLDGIRSVKVSLKKVNIALDKELRGR
jgi:hypothetical protein